MKILLEIAELKLSRQQGKRSYYGKHAAKNDIFFLSFCRRLDESSIKAVGSLLHNLPLHPDEGDGGDVPRAKSQLFLK